MQATIPKLHRQSVLPAHAGSVSLAYRQPTTMARTRLGTRVLRVKTSQDSEALHLEVRSLHIGDDGQRYGKREACYQQAKL